MPSRAEILSWLHIGDLHITQAGEKTHRDLLGIVDLLNGLAPERRFAAGPNQTASRPAVPERGIFGTHLGLDRNGREW